MPHSPFGYRGNPEWRDMSDYLLHFTNSIDDLTSVLDAQEVRADTKFGAAKGLGAPALPLQASACLSEIPLDYLDRLVERHGNFGVGFEKTWSVGQGATRVWYLDKGTPVQGLILEWASGGGGPNWEQDKIYDLTPYIDHVGTFNGVRHEFEWEREWRVRGGLKFAVSTDVPFVFAPEETHQDERIGQIPLLLDAQWSFDRLQESLAELDGQK